MAQEIVLILAYTPTSEKQDKLRGLLNTLNHLGYRSCLITHSSTPKDIIDRCDYFIYDKDNPVLFDPDIKYWTFQKYDSLHLSFKDYSVIATHGIALWRMYSGALSYLKSLGEEIVHMIEYDTIIKNKDIFEGNSQLLQQHDIGAVLYSLPRFYNEKKELLCNWPFQSINISKIPYDLLEYDFDKLKSQYQRYFNSRHFPVIERMFYDNIWKNVPNIVVKLSKEEDLNPSLYLNNERISGSLWLTINSYQNKLFYFIANKTKEQENYTFIIDNTTIDISLPPGHWRWKPFNVDNPNLIRIFKNNVLIKELNLSKSEDRDLIYKYSKVKKVGKEKTT